MKKIFLAAIMLNVVGLVWFAIVVGYIFYSANLSLDQFIDSIGGLQK